MNQKEIDKIKKPSAGEAAWFARQFFAGAPGVVIIQSRWPDLEENDALDVANAWLADPVVSDSLAELYGGDFESMDEAEQIATAIDKSHRERAWFLFAHHYAEVTGNLERKYEKAYQTLTKWFPPTEANSNDPVQQFMAEIRKEAKKKETLN